MEEARQERNLVEPLSDTLRFLISLETAGCSTLELGYFMRERRVLDTARRALARLRRTRRPRPPAMPRERSSRLQDFRYIDVVRMLMMMETAGFTREEMHALADDPGLARMLRCTLLRLYRMRLMHGRFQSLEEKVEMVAEWPGMGGSLVDRARDEARPQIEAFELLHRDHPGLDLVVCVYLRDAASTLAFAMERIAEQHVIRREGSAQRLLGQLDPNDVAYVPRANVPVLDDRFMHVRIELIDLTALWDGRRPIRVGDVSTPLAAHFGVLYAIAQDHEYVRDIADGATPSLRVPGLRFRSERSGEMEDVLMIGGARTDDAVELEMRLVPEREYTTRSSAPTLVL